MPGGAIRYGKSGVLPGGAIRYGRAAVCAAAYNKDGKCFVLRRGTEGQGFGCAFAPHSVLRLLRAFFPLEFLKGVLTAP